MSLSQSPILSPSLSLYLPFSLSLSLNLPFSPSHSLSISSVSFLLDVDRSIDASCGITFSTITPESLDTPIGGRESAVEMSNYTSQNTTAAQNE